MARVRVTPLPPARPPAVQSSDRGDCRNDSGDNLAKGDVGTADEIENSIKPREGGESESERQGGQNQSSDKYQDIISSVSRAFSISKRAPSLGTFLNPGCLTAECRKQSFSFKSVIYAPCVLIFA